MNRLFQIVGAVAVAVALTTAASQAEPNYPVLTGRVVDQAGLLPDEARQRIEEKLRAHESETSNQVVVVTLNSLEGYPIEDYGVGLGRAWRIGQEGRDNGALLIVAPNEREVRIEVGYGLEGALTDALSRDIIESRILPAFRQDDPARGIEAGVDAMLAAIAGTYEPEELTEEDEWNFALFAFLVFFAFGVLSHFFLRHSKGGRRRGWLAGAGIGGGYSGGGGGGFSGGGGSFGGGGASGRW